MDQKKYLIKNNSWRIYEIYWFNVSSIADFFSVTAHSSAKDIKGSRYTLKSVVTEEKNFRFVVCDNRKIAGKCETIGDETGYSAEYLEWLKENEFAEATVKAGGVLIGAAAGALVFGTLGLITITAYTAAGQTAMLVTAGVLTGGSSLFFDKISPIHQFAQADVLNEKGLMTRTIVMKSDKEVLEIAELLSEILQ